MGKADAALSRPSLGGAVPRRVRRTLLVALLLVLLSGCGTASGTTTERQTLRVGLVPNVAPEAQRARYAPLGAHLERELGRRVELFVASSYAGVVTALAAGRLDLAYLGGLTYAEAERQVALTPLVTEVDRDTGTREYVSAVVVRADRPLRSLQDLLDAGASFAFGDPGSTSGSLYPRLLLDRAGADCSATTLTSCPPLSSIRFTGGHDATALAVAGGRVDAGGLELRILRRLEREGVVEPAALRVVAEERVMGYPWVGRTALGQRLLDDVSDAFLRIDDPVLLDLLRAKSYARVSPADYDEVRREAGRLGLLR
jgi:phosphonate transport system substrate-binding protein